MNRQQCLRVIPRSIRHQFRSITSQVPPPTDITDGNTTTPVLKSPILNIKRVVDDPEAAVKNCFSRNREELASSITAIVQLDNQRRQLLELLVPLLKQQKQVGLELAGEGRKPQRKEIRAR